MSACWIFRCKANCHKRHKNSYSVTERIAERQGNTFRVTALRHTPFRTDTLCVFCAFCGQFFDFLFFKLRLIAVEISRCAKFRWLLFEGLNAPRPSPSNWRPARKSCECSGDLSQFSIQPIQAVLRPCLNPVIPLIKLRNVGRQSEPGVLFPGPDVCVNFQNPQIVQRLRPQ